MTRRKNRIESDQIKSEKPTIECPSFDEAVDLFLKEQKILNRTPRTIEWHQENFNALKKAFQEQNIEMDLAAITSKHLKHNFILYTLEKYNNKATTINNRMRTYKSFWKFLFKEGYLDTDITQSIKKLKEKKQVIITLDKSEIAVMFKICNKKTFTGLRDLTMMKTLIDTGIRLQEIVLLSIQDIFFKENLIKIDGKGYKERFVPLSNELKKVLKEYLAVRGELPTDALFVTLENTPMAPRTVQNRLEDIKKAANISKQASPHIWRHSFAKFFILNGGDPFSLKKILGHSDWEMVHRYVDMFAPELKQQHQKASPLKNL